MSTRYLLSATTLASTLPLIPVKTRGDGRFRTLKKAGNRDVCIRCAVAPLSKIISRGADSEERKAG